MFLGINKMSMSAVLGSAGDPSTMVGRVADNDDFVAHERTPHSSICKPAKLLAMGSPVPPWLCMCSQCGPRPSRWAMEPNMGRQHELIFTLPTPLSSAAFMTGAWLIFNPMLH